jgi:hypothetical protein
MWAVYITNLQETNSMKQNPREADTLAFQLSRTGLSVLQSCIMTFRNP